MGSSYGTAWPLPLIGARDSGANQTCTAGADTTIITFSSVAAVQPGFYYPVIFAALALTMGATAPSAIAVKAKLNGGAAFATVNLWTSLLTNNGNIYVPVIMQGTTSGSLWFPGPVIVTLAVNPTGQNVTYTDAPSQCRVALERGNDS
jgi:hypothetical protein